MFSKSYAASLLPKQGRGTLRNLFTKPAKQPDGGQCNVMGDGELILQFGSAAGCALPTFGITETFL